MILIELVRDVSPQADGQGFDVVVIPKFVGGTFNVKLEFTDIAASDWTHAASSAQQIAALNVFRNSVDGGGWSSPGGDSVSLGVNTVPFDFGVPFPNGTAYPLVFPIVDPGNNPPPYPSPSIGPFEVEEEFELPYTEELRLWLSVTDAASLPGGWSCKAKVTIEQVE